MEDKKINIKLLVDKTKNQLVFAESDRHFVEVLFSFLILPIGRIIRLTDEQSNLGCMDDLYRSVEALDVQYLQTEACKEMLLNPRSAAEEKYRSLALSYGGSTDDYVSYYKCSDWPCRNTPCLLSMFKYAKCRCGEMMNRIWVDRNSIKQNKLNGVFVSGNENFTISDDLHIRLISTETILSLLHRYGIEDITSVEERIISVGTEEALNLLKRALFSKTPITDVFLSKQQEFNEIKVKSEPVDLVLKSEAKKIKLTLLIRKSNNKVLYATAKQDFVNFMFSILAFPVASIVKLLDGNAFLGSIDNVYKSVNDLINEESQKFKECKDTLLDPKVACHHGCENHLLPVKEQVSEFNIDHEDMQLINPKFKDDIVTETGRGFVKESKIFMITDELIVAPLSPISGISYVNKLGVPLNDLEERVVNVGVQEALLLLKASLTSKTALTKVFCRSKN